jgi:hypothetical protein
MAGKTFHGIGGIEDEAPPLGPDGAAPDTADSSDVRGVYSGPTVVDDDKVAAGLERLRALEMPADLSESVAELVVDSGSSEPTKIGQPFLARPTAVGRSLGSEHPSQDLVIPNDPLRGTMFGHTVHLPDLHVPVEAEDASSSGPIYVPPPAAQAPATTQMVRYQDRPQPFAGSTPFPRNAQPFPLAEVFPPHERDLRTETIPPMSRQPVFRFVAGVVALAVLGGGAYAWMRQRAADDEAIPTMPVAPPTIGLEQVPAPSAPPAAAEPAAVDSPAAGAAPVIPPPPAAPAVAAPAVAAPAPVAAPTRTQPADDGHERSRSSRSERRRTSTAPSSATSTPRTSDAPAVPPAPRARKKPVLEEDPDATLPPSLVE